VPFVTICSQNAVLRKTNNLRRLFHRSRDDVDWDCAVLLIFGMDYSRFGSADFLDGLHAEEREVAGCSHEEGDC